MLRNVDEAELSEDPLAQLGDWLRDAQAVSAQHDAMTLATATTTGRPSARQILLRGLDERGLVFFTNRTSRKAAELLENPHAALVFHWYELGRQARIEGSVEEVDEVESEAYWRTRPRESQIAAWASPQSQTVEDREELDGLYATADLELGEGEVPLPPFWGGYRVVPHSVELWQHRENRLHDRVRYRRTASGWTRERLAP
jgi:pyridoxamine 5'-phosphate oxidase